jgi:hypothetical protein
MSGSRRVSDFQTSSDTIGHDDLAFCFTNRLSSKGIEPRDSLCKHIVEPWGCGCSSGVTGQRSPQRCFAALNLHTMNSSTRMLDKTSEHHFVRRPFYGSRQIYGSGHQSPKRAG